MQQQQAEQKYVIGHGVVEAVFGYLSRKPWNEVQNLIAGIQGVQPYDEALAQVKLAWELTVRKEIEASVRAELMQVVTKEPSAKEPSATDNGQAQEDVPSPPPSGASESV